MLLLPLLYNCEKRRYECLLASDENIAHAWGKVCDKWNNNNSNNFTIFLPLS